MQSKTIVELNGKRYDAVTGAVIGDAKAAPVRSGKNIDGFFRSRTMPSKTSSAVQVQQTQTTVAAPAAPQPPRKPARERTLNHAKAHAPMPAKTVPARKEQSTPISVARPNGPRPTGVQVNHAKAHAVQDSTTLMRKAVKRPQPSLHKQLRPVGALQGGTPNLIVPKQSVATVDEARLARAQTTPRSPHVTRHGSTMPTLQPSVVPLAVQPIPVKPEGEVPPTSPPPQPSNKPTTDIFEHALANASHFVDTHAHTQAYKKHVRRHISSMVAGTLALVVMAGLAAYQNTPGLQFKVASVQAGVSTHMPNLKASGFAFTGVKAQNNKLTVGFTGISGKYQLIQERTNLSSEDVIKDVGSTDATGAPNYDTISAGNTTVYRLSNTNATWVSNGTWYTVTGGNLTDSQLQSLARNS